MTYSYEKYVDKLQGEYLDEFKKVEKNIQSSGMNHDEIEDSMYQIIDLFIKGKNDNKTVSEITDGDLEKFCRKYSYEFKTSVKRDNKLLIGSICRVLALIVCMSIITFVNIEKGIINHIWRGYYDTGYVGTFILAAICTSLIINFLVSFYKVKDKNNAADILKKYDLLIAAVIGIVLMVIKNTLNIPVKISLEWTAGSSFCIFVVLLLIDQIIWYIRVYDDKEMIIRKNIKEIRDGFNKQCRKQNISMKDYLKSYSSNRVLKKWFMIVLAVFMIVCTIFMFYFDGMKAAFSLSYILLILMPCFSNKEDKSVLGFVFNYKYESKAIEMLRKLYIN